MFFKAAQYGEKTSGQVFYTQRMRSAYRQISFLILMADGVLSVARSMPAKASNILPWR